MFYLEKYNEKVGRYLNRLIDKSSYPNVRQFCIAYLKLEKTDISTESIAKMQNRMSQIINGKKAIQTRDLPIFCELLEVSCEEILSAGKHYEPISNHVTNYEIAFSHDKKTWDRYINREDKLFLNPDEYNKTVIDYALEFKNYKFMKYLMDNGYIWFVDDSKHDCTDRVFGFGAGTSIKRRETGFIDNLGTELQYHCEKHGLRQKMIALAIENNDFDTLTNLRAREIPALYQLCVYTNPNVRCNDYYNEDVILEIEKASDRVLGYFSEEFEITDQFGNKHTFVYPYLSALLDQMINNKNKNTELLLRRAIAHNRQVLNKLQFMVNEAFELAKNSLNYADSFNVPIDDVARIAMNFFRFDCENHFLTYFFTQTKPAGVKFCANAIIVHNQSSDLSIDHLIKELNNYYDAICNIKPNTTNY